MTAPESSPKPAEAIALGYAKRMSHYHDCDGRGTRAEKDRDNADLILDAHTELLESAAIQRGDGQDWRKLSVTSVAAENSSVAEYIAQLERTTTTAAQPNETSGATPRTDAVAKRIGYLAGQYKAGDLSASAFMYQAQDELDKLGSIERELNALRKSAGAEGAEAALEEIVSDYEFCKAHTPDVERSEAYYDTAKKALAGRYTLTTERIAGAAAKSTPGVEAEELAYALEGLMESGTGRAHTFAFEMLNKHRAHARSYAARAKREAFPDAGKQVGGNAT